MIELALEAHSEFTDVMVPGTSVGLYTGIGSIHYHLDSDPPGYQENALEVPNSSLIVPYQSDTNIAKRSYLSEGVFLCQSNKNIAGFCYNNSSSLEYWCGIDDDDYDYCNGGSPYFTPVPDEYKENEDQEWKGVVGNPRGDYIESSRPFSSLPEQTDSLALRSFWELFPIAGFTSFFWLLLFVVSGIYSSVKKHTLINLKSKLFKKNGGLLLEQYVASHGPAAGCTKIFTGEELELATKYYYNKNNHTFSQRPGSSSSTHGTPADSVMGKPFVTELVLVEDGQIARFINEIITLSQINHQNVIKLFGCCLETEAPSLVYEFASNGTLFDYIHDWKNGKAAILPHLTWWHIWWWR